MTDASNTSDPAAGAPGGGDAAQQPSVRILAQYIKDLSFESPKAPMSLQPREQTPPININVNVNARGLNQEDYEVTLTLDAKAGEGDDLMFHVELQYGGVFRLGGIKQEHLQPFLLIEGPRMLFPFARQVIATTVQGGGFPPLMIDPIDFISLYRRNAARAAQAQQSADAAGTAPN